MSGYIKDGLKNNTGKNNKATKYINKVFFILRSRYFAFLYENKWESPEKRN